MKHYDPRQPLISLHIPKCAGQSVRKILEQWFGDAFYIHYFQQYNAPPPKHELTPGMCIHGHFNRTRGFGAADYYPSVNQFITILRDPLEMMISNYFFWKKKARARQLESGIIKEGDEHDYKNIDDFFEKRRRSHIPDFLHREVTEDNVKEVVENDFIYIGVMEDLQASMDILARKLGFPPVTIPHINRSGRDEELSPGQKDRFIRDNRLAYSIYFYALECHNRETDVKPM